MGSSCDQQPETLNRKGKPGTETITAFAFPLPIDPSLSLGEVWVSPAHLIKLDLWVGDVDCVDKRCPQVVPGFPSIGWGVALSTASSFSARACSEV